jgi:hypothetical protein
MRWSRQRQCKKPFGASETMTAPGLGRVKTLRRRRRRLPFSGFDYARIAAISGCDLTGLFCTKRCERMSLAKELGNAEEAV